MFVLGMGSLDSCWETQDTGKIVILLPNLH